MTTLLTTPNLDSQNGSALLQAGAKRPAEESTEAPSAKLPKTLTAMFCPLECKLCNVKVTGTLVAKAHYDGKAHAKKVAAFMRSTCNINLPSKKTNTPISATCDVCNVQLTSETQANQHYSGKAHAKNVLKHKRNPNGLSPVKVPTALHDPSGRFGIGIEFVPPDQRVDLVAVENSKTFCELCNVTVTSEEMMVSHVNGIKHRKKLRNSTKLDKMKEDELDLLAQYRTPSNYYFCTVCNIRANLPDNFLIHLKSKKHIRSAMKAPKETPVNVEQILQACDNQRNI